MTFHRALITLITILAGLVILFHFAHPQWHKWVFMQKTYGPLSKYYETVDPDITYTGVWRHWNRKGVLVAHVHFLKGRQHGLESRWDNAGHLLYITRYENGHEMEIVYRHEVIDRRRDFDIPLD